MTTDLDRKSGAGGPNVADIPPISGAYILAIRTARPVEITVRGLPAASLRPGWYAYAGSARGPGGLAARIARHLRIGKTPHWHVDRLTCAAARIDALAFPGAYECLLLARLRDLPGATIPLPGFGASDCTACPAHLVALAEPLALDAPYRTLTRRASYR